MLDKYIPPKRLRTPLPQKSMMQDGNLVKSGDLGYDVSIGAASLRPIYNGSTIGYCFFVDVTTGSNSNDGMSWANAKETIQGAIDLLPIDLGGREVAIFVHGGLYHVDNMPVISLSGRNNGRIELYWVGTWYNALVPGMDYYWVKEYGGVFTATNDPIICETKNPNYAGVIYSGWTGGNNTLMFSLKAVDLTVQTWNLLFLRKKWIIRHDPTGTANNLPLVWLRYMKQVNLTPGDLTVDVNLLNREAFKFEYCTEVTMYGIDMINSGLTPSGCQTGTGDWNTLISLTNSNLVIDGYASARYKVGETPTDPNKPFEVAGIRNLVKYVTGSSSNGVNKIGMYLNYSQGLMPDANIPNISINTNALNYNVHYNPSMCNVVNNSIYAGSIKDVIGNLTQIIVAQGLTNNGGDYIVSIANAETTNSKLIAKSKSCFLNEATGKLVFKVKYNDGITVKSGSIDLVAPLEYTALLSETGYAATSGLLVEGQTYYIASYVAGDDFTNVGGTNVTGNTFVASGTTPTTWTNSSILVSVGISAPAVTLLANSLSGAIVWTYSAVGTYIGTLSGAFTENKTVFSYPPLGDDKAVTVEWTSANVITVKTYETGALKDGLLVKFPLTIKVYP